MPTQIKCTVDNCVYNSHHYCEASSIEVNANNGLHMANHEVDTNCHTFKAKDG